MKPVPTVVRNRLTHAVVNRYKARAAARAHVALFPADYIAPPKAPKEKT